MTRRQRPGNQAAQRGLTLLGFLFAVAIAGLLGTLALRLGPVYLNHFKVIASLEAVTAQPNWAASSREQILSTLQKRWEIDSVDDVTARDVTIVKDGQAVQVRVAYEVTRPFVRNIDLLIHFDETIEAVPH